MSFQYSGGTIVNRVFSAATRQDIVSNVTQALLDAGWTTISGTPGSGSDVIQETAANNVGAKIRLRSWDPATGSSSLHILKHPAGITADAGPCALRFIAGSFFRVCATARQVYVFRTTTANVDVAASAMFAGTLYTPTFLPVSSGDGIGYQAGSSSIDETGSRSGWRKILRSQFSGNWQGGGYIFQNIALSVANFTGLINPSVASWQGGKGPSDFQGWRWEDNTQFAFEPLVCAPYPAGGSEQKILGQLYDTMCLNVDNVAGQAEQMFQLDGHTWLTITDMQGPAYGCNNILCVTIT